MNIEAGDRSGKLVAELTDVSKTFGERKVIDNFTCRIQRGDKIGLLGPNGAGKSTLLKIILGEMQADTGDVKLGTKLSVAYFDQLRAQLDEDATLGDTISQGSDFIEIGGVRKHVISYLGDFLFAPERVRSPVKSLSGGERNRLLLARLFTRPANVLVLDEPFQGLDPVNIQLVRALVAELRAAGKAILLSSHQLVHVEALADRVALIHRGHIVAHGTLEDLRCTYARGDLAVGLADDAPLPPNLPLQQARKRDGVWYVLPQDGVSPHEVLRALVAAGAPVERFEVVYPSLEEIFLRAVAAAGDTVPAVAKEVQS
jgi:ABC-type multidrug transport system ATPase subunit